MGIVYVIEGSGLTYYGSTIQTLKERIYKHNGDYRKWLSGKIRYMSSFEIIKGDYTFKIVEECENYKERERWWIENNKCVNLYIPLRTRKEYDECYKEEIKEYQQEYHNKRFICECGSNIKIGEKSSHLKTQKHLRYLENKQIM